MLDNRASKKIEQAKRYAQSSRGDSQLIFSPESLSKLSSFGES